MIQIQRTGELKSRTLNVLVYGPPGAGKTRFAGTCSPRFKPLILSAESGLLSLNQMGSFDYVKIEKWEQVEEVRMDLRHGKLKYDTVILDSITEIQQVCASKILTEVKKGEAPKDRLSLPDWGTLAQRMIDTIRDFRDMDLNLIVTALAASETSEETGIQRIIPMVQGQLKDKLAAYFDEVFYLHSVSLNGVVQRALVTQGTDKIPAKDRSGVLAAREEPDFCKIFDKIFKPKEAV